MKKIKTFESFSKDLTDVVDLKIWSRNTTRDVVIDWFRHLHYRLENEMMAFKQTCKYFNLTMEEGIEILQENLSQNFSQNLPI